MTPSAGVVTSQPEKRAKSRSHPVSWRAPETSAISERSRTASLRPFNNRSDAEAAVENIRGRGRLIVGLDIGSNLFSFRDPITGGRDKVFGNAELHLVPVLSPPAGHLPRAVGLAYADFHQLTDHEVEAQFVEEALDGEHGAA